MSEEKKHAPDPYEKKLEAWFYKLELCDLKKYADEVNEAIRLNFNVLTKPATALQSNVITGENIPKLLQMHSVLSAAYNRKKPKPKKRTVKGRRRITRIGNLPGRKEGVA